MITVKTTADRELSGPADVVAYLKETASTDRFKPGDVVKIIDRSSLPISSFVGDVGIVAGFDTPGAPFVSVRGLFQNGVITSQLIQADILAPYTEENTGNG